MADESAYLVTYTAYSAGEGHSRSGMVPVEGMVTFYLNGQPFVSVMCTPTHLKELALGFLFNEGLIRSPRDVTVMELCGGGRCVDIWLGFDVEIPNLRVITSGCSGGTTFEEIVSARHRVEADLSINADQIAQLMDELSRQASLYHRSGGVHAAGLAHAGQFVCVAEDVGRHNALDKIAGTCLQMGHITLGGVLLTSGRISSEMVQKAARMEVPVVISRTSPTSLAVQLAQAWSITLIGYARRGTFHVYTHERRVVTSGAGG